MNKKILDLIGNTPLIEIKKMNKNKNVKVLVKAEWHNLSGSIKDRAALSMIEDGERTGKLTKSKTIMPHIANELFNNLTIKQFLLSFEDKIQIQNELEKAENWLNDN